MMDLDSFLVSLYVLLVDDWWKAGHREGEGFSQRAFLRAGDVR